MMALGALFGALNTMYSAVAARTREIATLRALGFGSGPVVISILVESLCLALLGGAIGALAFAAAGSNVVLVARRAKALEGGGAECEAGGGGE